MLVREIMTTTTWAVSPEATLDEAAQVMTSHRFTTLPVVDDDGRLLGLLTEADVLGAPRPSADPESGVMLSRSPRTAAAAMRPPLGAALDADVAELANRMADAGVRALPVLSDGRVVGMITFQDVLAASGG